MIRDPAQSPTPMPLILAIIVALITTTLITIDMQADELEPVGGAAVLRIMPNENNVQQSNFGAQSFTLSNTGSKRIIAFELDVTHALYPDTVFDPEGIAGDSVAKPLKIDNVGQPQPTGIIAIQTMQESPYVGAGGTQGYEGLRLLFDTNQDDGFNPGETLGFSIDMDPNSIAGTDKRPLDRGASPRWDVGGVSGAELIGSTFTVTFEDNTQAHGQLHGTATQAGSHGIASQNAPRHRVSLTVNDLKPGQHGTYNANHLKVIVNGPAGQTARVVLTHGLIQPVTPYNQTLNAQLQQLAQNPFPANNAVAFQTLDIPLNGKVQDITEQLLQAPRPAYDFIANPDQPFSMDADKLPIGIVAAIIDPQQDNLPSGPVTPPIYLRYESNQTR